MKRILFSAAFVAAVLSSCSKEEVIDTGVSNLESVNPNKIMLDGSTTRATTNYLKDVGTGFRVYANVTGATEWYGESDGITAINGSHLYYDPAAVANPTNSLNWQWGSSSAPQTPGATITTVSAPAWPTSGYPMSFYAAYPRAELTAIAPGSTGGPSVKGAITVLADRFAQVDHLAATASAAEKPATGRLALTFNHIMSRVNVSIETDVDYTIEVQSVKFVNAHNNATYEYATSPGWGTTSTPADFEYRRTVQVGADAVGTGTGYLDDVFSYTQATAGEASSMVHENDAAADGSLMLLPQTFTQVILGADGDIDFDEEIVTTPAVVTNADGTYIEVLYRIQDKDTNDIIGRKNILDIDAEQKSYFTSADLSGDKITTTAELEAEFDGTNTYPGYAGATANYKNTGVAEANDALYVKAWFPVYYESRTGDNVGRQTWASQADYIYVLKCGFTAGGGGFYADNQYYDEAGNGTGLYFPKTEGEPVFNNDLIHFDVAVSTWDGETSQDLE